MALSTPESDVELARRQREGVFTPPPHWKPRQEEVDLGKEYAFKRAQREGGVFDPVEVCVEINQFAGCILGDDAAVLARSSGEEPAPLRHPAERAVKF